MPVPENTQESDQYQWTTVTRSRRNRPTNNDFHQETKHQLKSTTTTKRSSIKPQTEYTEDTEKTEEDYMEQATKNKQKEQFN